MGRPRSTDRKEIVTLRLRQSVIDAYKAMGDDWRARIEAAIEGALEKPAKAAPKHKATSAAPKVRKAAAEPREAPSGPIVQVGPVQSAPGSRLKKR